MDSPWLGKNDNYLLRADEIRLKTVETRVPRTVRTIMTTIAISTIINAYSTIP
jgi:hypothetical protein